MLSKLDRLLIEKKRKEIASPPIPPPPKPKPKRKVKTIHSNIYLNKILNIFDCGRPMIQKGNFIVACGTIFQHDSSSNLEKRAMKVIKKHGLPVKRGRGTKGIPDFKIDNLRVELKSMSDGLKYHQFEYIADHPRQLILILFLKRGNKEYYE